MFRRWTGCDFIRGRRVGPPRPGTSHCNLEAWPGHVPSSELVEEPRVVLVEQADVVDPVSTHAEPFDAQPEREPGDLVGVVADGPEDVGVDHAGPPHLDPSVAAVPEH